MPKNSNQSGKRNFLITMSKQTNGSNGFMPSGKNHQRRNFWYLVIGIIVVIILFIFGENMLASHQSNEPASHHTKVTRVTKKNKTRHQTKKRSNRAKNKSNNDAKKRSARAKKLAQKQRKINAKRNAANHARVASRYTDSEYARNTVRTTAPRMYNVRR